MSMSRPAPCFQQCLCGGLTLAGCRMPTELLSHSPSSTAQDEKVRSKSLWLRIKAGRSLINYRRRQNRTDWGKLNLIYWQFKIEKDGEKQRQNENYPPSILPPSFQIQLYPFVLTLLAPPPWVAHRDGEWDCPIQQQNVLVLITNPKHGTMWEKLPLSHPKSVCASLPLLPLHTFPLL